MRVELNQMVSSSFDSKGGFDPNAVSNDRSAGTPLVEGAADQSQPAQRPSDRKPPAGSSVPFDMFRKLVNCTKDEAILLALLGVISPISPAGFAHDVSRRKTELLRFDVNDINRARKAIGVRKCEHMKTRLSENRPMVFATKSGDDVLKSAAKADSQPAPVSQPKAETAEKFEAEQFEMFQDNDLPQAAPMLESPASNDSDESFREAVQNDLSRIAGQVTMMGNGLSKLAKDSQWEIAKLEKRNQDLEDDIRSIENDNTSEIETLNEYVDELRDCVKESDKVQRAFVEAVVGRDMDDILEGLYLLDKEENKG